MTNTLVKILLIGLLLLVVTAPFAGLAPLMVILLICGVSSVLWSLLRTLFIGDTERNDDGVKEPMLPEKNLVHTTWHTDKSNVPTAWR